MKLTFSLKQLYYGFCYNNTQPFKKMLIFLLDYFHDSSVILREQIEKHNKMSFNICSIHESE